MIKIITQIFEQSAQLKLQSLQRLAPSIVQAGKALIAALQQGNKVLICGNGGSAADAQHFASELINRFEHDRLPLAAVALTTDCSALTSIANDFDYTQVFSRQVAGLGQAGDVLVAISTSGNSPNIVRAATAAKQKNMLLIGLCGERGNLLEATFDQNDILLSVPSQNTARIQEVHIVIIHSLCALIDDTFCKK